jgi:hypothetical protein
MMFASQYSSEQAPDSDPPLVPQSPIFGSQMESQCCNSDSHLVMTLHKEKQGIFISFCLFYSFRINSLISRNQAISLRNLFNYRDADEQLRWYDNKNFYLIILNSIIVCAGLNKHEADILREYCSCLTREVIQSRQDRAEAVGRLTAMRQKLLHVLENS